MGRLRIRYRQSGMDCATQVAPHLPVLLPGRSESIIMGLWVRGALVGLPSNRPALEIQRLRRRVNALARENNELRHLVQATAHHLIMDREDRDSGDAPSDRDAEIEALLERVWSLPPPSSTLEPEAS